MNTAPWDEIVLCRLTDHLADAGLTFEKLRLPSELADIGGGAGVSYSIRDANGTQLGAVTRYHANPDETIVLALGPATDELLDRFRALGQRIADETSTSLCFQGILVVQ